MRGRVYVTVAAVAAVAAIAAGPASPASAATFTYSVASEPDSMTATDLDADGDNDLIIGTRNGLIQTWRNNGSGRFGLAFSGSPLGDIALTDLAAGDMNRDGRGDVVLGIAGIPGKISILFSRGDGGFQPPATYDSCYSTMGVAVADINSDSSLDVAAVNQCFKASPFYNDGSGVLSSGGDHGHGYTPVRVALSDLDGDGDTDIAYTNWGIMNVTVLRNTGGGTFSTFIWYQAGDGPWDLVAFDADRDGDNDLAVADTFATRVSILRNRGDASFDPPVAVTTGQWPRSIAAADLDGDNDLDLATANQDTDNVSILRNTAGAFAQTRVLAAGDRPHDLILANLDNTGRPDLAVIAFNSSRLTIITNPGT